MKGYKAVSNVEGTTFESFSWFAKSKDDLNTIYRIGETSIKKQNPLLVFTNIDCAITFVHEHTIGWELNEASILECEYEKSENQDTSFLILKHELPGGTVCADTVTPTKVVDRERWLPYESRE